MVISNIHNDHDIELKYDENILKIVENHKHLEVTISQTINGQSIKTLYLIQRRSNYCIFEN